MQYLHEILDNPIVRKIILETEIPRSIINNIKFELRPYQEEAFKRYLYFEKNDFDGKQPKPHHILFNMATGSGKTLIMAGLILYLYEKGYRNFLFFVHRENIIKKTKDNFLNQRASKYLFKNKITINDKEIQVKEISTLEESDDRNINIIFTTIQQLHIDLTNTKENSVTYEDLTDKKIVMIADEAHHLNADTKKSDNDVSSASWETTVLNILYKNRAYNTLLEFTATIDLSIPYIVDKYLNKIIYAYNLKQYRLDGFSKEVKLLRSMVDDVDRMLQALILNLYRQEMASKHNINLKPVVLFKAKRTIEESKIHQENFHNMVSDLTVETIEHIFNKCDNISVLRKAVTFFENEKITLSDIVIRLKFNFKMENCLCVNKDHEKDKNQILLNTLEDENNPIRAIFAVEKLNEGWDVLNLFDIVRLYKERDTGRAKIGKTTMSEAQLIGRGARYYPFIIEEGQDKYKRKYDDDVSNDLKILEELYYHTIDDSKYISEITNALVSTGIMDHRNLVTKQLRLKDNFKKTDFYHFGYVIHNEKFLSGKNQKKIKSFSNFNIKKTNHRTTLASWVGFESLLFPGGSLSENENIQLHYKTLYLRDIPIHVIHFALSKNKFFHYNDLQNLVEIRSHNDFIQKFLYELAITFQGTVERLNDINNNDFLNVLLDLLCEIEKEIKDNISEYGATEFKKTRIHDIFKDKDIRVVKYSDQEDGQENVVKDAGWYVYNANYGTDQEKKFVELFSKKYETIKHQFKEIYLIRNERELKIYNKQGNAFQPDFLLFCIKENGKKITYQVFIEPKGKHLQGHDKWKEDFLKEIAEQRFTMQFQGQEGIPIEYIVSAVPFYNYDNENKFLENLTQVLHD